MVWRFEMNKATQELFQDVRSILNDETTAKNWNTLRDRLSSVFPRVAYDNYSSGVKKNAQQVLDEIFPYIRQELDAKWPDEVRIVSIYDHARVQELGKVLEISFYGSTQQSYGEHFGKKYTTAITKKLIKEMMPHWIRAEDHEFEGLILEHVDKYHEHLLEQLLAVNFANLRYVRFEDLSAPYKKGTYDADTNAFTALTNKLIDLRGESLESFGGSFSGSTSIPALYGPLLERADELPNLNWLCFTHPLYASDEDLFDDFMKHPHYDKVKTLTFPNGMSLERANTLINRKASINLERIGVGYFGYYTPKFELRQLIDDEYMANVQIWDVREDRRNVDDFVSKEAREWSDYKNGVERNDLVHRVVDLTGYDQQRTHKALFDDEGNLRPAPNMRALRIQHIRGEDLDEVIDHGHEIWPELECLVFQFCPYDDDYDADIAWLERWNTSPWMTQLDFLDWDESIYHPYARAIGQHRGRSKERETQAIFDYFDLLLEDNLCPFLSRRAWEAISGCVSRKPDASKLAKQVGIEGYSKLDRYKILQKVGQYLHETFGWEGNLKNKGPNYACHDWTKEFEW